MAESTILLSVAGLSLDCVGAAFLAYDVLYGPEARFQAAIRRERLANVRARRAVRQLSGVQPSARLTSPPEPHTGGELPEGPEAYEILVAELRYWEKHEYRAKRNALLGLMLLMAGFALQALSNVLSASALGIWG